MNCPFCEQALKIPEESLSSGEFHYDCPFCNSSLLFEKGSCQVLVEGALPEIPLAPKEISTDSTGPALQETTQKGKVPEVPIEEATIKSSVPEPSDSQDEGGLLQPEESLEDSHKPDQARVTQSAGESKILETETEADLPQQASQVVTKEDAASLEQAPPEDSHYRRDCAPLEEVTDEAPTDEIQKEPVDEEENTAGGVPFVDEESLPEESAGLNKDSASTESLSDNSNTDNKPEDFSDIEKFGNISGHAHKGPFYYNLTIEEINSKQSREHLQDVLSDEGLTFPPVEIKDGTLKLLRLTPAACHVIVKSLLGWPFKISWEQELVADQTEDQTDSAPAVPSEEPEN